MIVNRPSNGRPYVKSKMRIPTQREQMHRDRIAKLMEAKHAGTS